MRRFLGLLVLACALSSIASGCGGGSSEVKVSGSVVQGATPLEGVDVGFDPADPKQGSANGTVTDASGKFEIGLKAGSYTVILKRMVDKQGKLAKAAPGDDPALQDRSRVESALRQSLPAKFTSKTTSPIKVEIAGASKDLPPFDVSK